MLADFPDIKFNVDNFNKSNMRTIEANWDATAAAIRSAVKLVSNLGFNRDNLAATNTIIPIAYFVYKNNLEENILHSIKHAQDRRAINEWLARVLLKGTFGGQPDSIYPGMRDLISANMGRFPLLEIINHYKGRNKSISFSEDDVESLLELKCGKAKTYSALTLLYPGLNTSFKYHQDHLHPHSFFKKKALRKLGFDAETVDAYLDQCNSLANLQLLQANQNIEKSDKSLEKWVSEVYPITQPRNAFLVQNHIGLEQSLAFENFLEFMDVRQQNIKTKLMTLLGVNTQSKTEAEPA